MHYTPVGGLVPETRKIQRRWMKLLWVCILPKQNQPSGQHATVAKTVSCGCWYTYAPKPKHVTLFCFKSTRVYPCFYNPLPPKRIYNPPCNLLLECSFRVSFRCLCVIFLASARKKSLCPLLNTAMPLHFIPDSRCPSQPFGAETLDVSRRTADSVLVSPIELPFLSTNMTCFGIRLDDMRITKPAK